MNDVYQINKPYPQPCGLAENKRAGCLLLKSYCGTCSELTLANQYTYHYLQSMGEYVPVSEALRSIALVEHQHMLMLGAVIRQLGVRPKLRVIGEGGSKYWNSRNVVYGSEVKDMLLADIESEQEQIRQYGHAMRRIGNTQVQALLARMIEDEQLHIRVLTSLHNKYF